MAKRLPPDPEHKNEERSEWVKECVALFRENTGADEGDALSDLLADIGHYCDRNGLSFEAELKRAAMHYTDETNGKGKQLFSDA